MKSSLASIVSPSELARYHPDIDDAFVSLYSLVISLPPPSIPSHSIGAASVCSSNLRKNQLVARDR